MRTPFKFSFTRIRDLKIKSPFPILISCLFLGGCPTVTPVELRPNVYDLVYDPQVHNSLSNDAHPSLATRNLANEKAIEICPDGFSIIRERREINPAPERSKYIYTIDCN